MTDLERPNIRPFSPLTSLIAYGPPLRPKFNPDKFPKMPCIMCGINISFNPTGLCYDCDKKMKESQQQLDQYMTDLIKWFRSVGWSYEQCKHALEIGLKVLK